MCGACLCGLDQVLDLGKRLGPVLRELDLEPLLLDLLVYCHLPVLFLYVCLESVLVLVLALYQCLELLFQSHWPWLAGLGYCRRCSGRPWENRDWLLLCAWGAACSYVCRGVPRDGLAHELWSVRESGSWCPYPEKICLEVHLLNQWPSSGAIPGCHEL